MSNLQNHGVVLGATGLMGWSVLNQLLSKYPKKNSFSKITAIIGRSVTEQELHVPIASPDRPELQIASGIDLENGTANDLAQEFRRKINDLEHVTHIFYFVFKDHGEDHIRECEMNCGMMQRVIDAFGLLAPNIKSFVYPGGTRGYGIYVPGGTFRAPLVESMADNLPEDYKKTVAYPWFRNILTEASRGRGWAWTEVCPDVVVGFTPNGSNYSLALHWAQYLSLYAYNSGITESSSLSDKRVEVPFPGSEGGYDALVTPVSSQTVGRVVVYAALNTHRCGGHIFNVADRERPSRFRELWPTITNWFGLVGVGPSGDESVLKPGEYIEQYKHLFLKNGCPKAMSCGVRAGSKQLDSLGWWLSFDRQLSLEKLRDSGFDEEREPAEGWIEAFAKFRNAGIIL